MQACELVGFLIANRRIAATLPIASVKHIPNAETMRKDAPQPPAVWHIGQWLAEQLGKQTPELVPRMCVVLARRQRCLRRKAAQDQALDLVVDYRWEPRSDGAADLAAGIQQHRIQTLDELCWIFELTTLC